MPSGIRLQRIADRIRQELSEMLIREVSDPRLQLEVKTEQEYYSAQSRRTSDLIMLLGWPLGIAMAFGALAGALNTMYTSVSMRAREAATIVGLVLLAVLIVLVFSNDISRIK